MLKPKAYYYRYGNVLRVVDITPDIDNSIDGWGHPNPERSALRYIYLFDNANNYFDVTQAYVPSAFMREDPRYGFNFILPEFSGCRTITLGYSFNVMDIDFSGSTPFFMESPGASGTITITYTDTGDVVPVTARYLLDVNGNARFDTWTFIRDGSRPIASSVTAQINGHNYTGTFKLWMCLNAGEGFEPTVALPNPETIAVLSKHHDLLKMASIYTPCSEGVNDVLAMSNIINDRRWPKNELV